MALGSFTSGALADLTVDDVDRMLELDETLFVEHKRSIGADKDSVHGLVSNVAAFANTLGGWLLIGVHRGRPDGDAVWAQEDEPALVDAIRDRLRLELDPMPAFEAKVVQHPDGPVGVVRVYESSDTPHVSMRTGAVFIREVAGVGNAAEPKQSGAGRHAERVFRAAQIRSRAQLLELASRGQNASLRVNRLLDPGQPLPLVAEGLRFQRRTGGDFAPRADRRGRVYVRLAPYTLPASFRGWATTSSASSATLAAAKATSGLRSLDSTLARPHPVGVFLVLEGPPAIDHADAAEGRLQTTIRVVIDGAGVVGTCLEFEAPNGMRRTRVHLDALAERYVKPALTAAAQLLQASHALGRARCQIDLVELGAAVLLEGQGNREAAPWVPSTSDIAFPASEDQLAAVAQTAAYAFARSAGIAAWDPTA